MNNNDKVREAIERAMARIGCPPGDNADADLYHELKAAAEALSAPVGEPVAWMTDYGEVMNPARKEYYEEAVPGSTALFTIPLYTHPPDRDKLVERIYKAVDDEPELPDEMPDAIWEACRSDRDTMQEALRVVVRLTKEGICSRLTALLNTPST